MSRQELAEAVNAYLWDVHGERAGLDASYVGKLELGRHRWPRARYREAFRTVLGAGSDAELGFFIVRGLVRGREPVEPPAAGAAGSSAGGGGVDDVDRRHLLAGLASPGIGALIRAVAGPYGAAAADDVSEPAGLDRVAARLAAAHGAYQHSRYSSSARILPSVVADLDRRRARGTDGLRVAALSAEAYQVAAALLHKADEPVLAAVAAERSVTAARASGDAVAVAASTRAVVHGLMSAGHAVRAAAVAEAGADRLATEADMDDAATVSVYGAVLLRGALAAARVENRDHAHALLEEAGRAATHLGRDANLHWTGFGPTNVAVHRVAVAADLGDAGTAVALAARVDITKLELPERKAMLLLDTARALTQWGKWEPALAAIQQAERHAPEEVRARPAVHALIGELTHRAPAPIQGRIRAYARRVGAAA